MITEFAGEHRFLSNFYPAPVTVHGVGYPTAEHAYQAHKTYSAVARISVAALSSPGEAKRAGRQLDIRPDWEQVKKQVMLLVVLTKFTAHDELAAALTATGDQLLVEGNHWHDNYWGMCSCSKCLYGLVEQENYHPRLFHENTVFPAKLHPGRNYLGKILMAVRDVVRPD